jgi:hypothetical protein
MQAESARGVPRRAEAAVHKQTQAAERIWPMSDRELEPIVVLDEPALKSLEAYLLSSDREQPVVALAQSLEAEEPVLASGDVRAIVGADARIYYLPAEHLLQSLQSILGRSLALPRGAARIWWPGLGSRSDPSDHPLVLELDGQPQAHTLAELARQFDLSRPRVRREIKLIEDTRRLAEHERAQALELLEATEERLRDTQVERHEEATRADAAEMRAKSAARELSALSCEERMHVLISREWLGALTASERRTHPLGAYVLTPELIATTECQPALPEDRLAWVCAMVACGLAPGLSEIAPGPLLSAPLASQLERADGAKAWRCRLEQGAAGTPHPAHLHYWMRADGTVEFAGVDYSDELATR